MCVSQVQGKAVLVQYSTRHQLGKPPRRPKRSAAKSEEKSEREERRVLRNPRSTLSVMLEQPEEEPEQVFSTYWLHTASGFGCIMSGL